MTTRWQKHTASEETNHFSSQGSHWKIQPSLFKTFFLYVHVRVSYCFLSVSLCAYMHILSLSGHPPGPVWIRGINQRLERPVMSHHVCISLQLSWKTTVDDGKPCSQSSKPAAVTHNGSVIIVHIITSQPLNLPCRQVDWRPLTGLLYSGRLLSLMQRQRESFGVYHARTRYPTSRESE